MIGDLASLDRPSRAARLPAAHGRSGTDVRDLLDRVREEDPVEPFWTGVRAVQTEDDAVAMAFHEPIDPVLVPAGAVRVACHLYDERAVEAALRAKRERHARLR